MRFLKILSVLGVLILLFGNASAEVSSVWSTSWDRLYLTQNGSSVTGRYVYYQNGNLVYGQIEGTLEENLLKGWWKQSKEPTCGPDKAWDGPLTLIFTGDGKSFIGDWGGCSESPESMNPSNKSWNGSLLDGVFKVDKWFERFSIWSTNWDRLYLIQKSSLLTGHYIYYEKGKPVYGQLEGYFENRLFRGWWKQSSDPSCGPDKAWDGPVTFLFAEEGESFIGDWGGCSDNFESLNPNDKSWKGTFVEGELKFKKSVVLPVVEAEKLKPSENVEGEVSSEWKTNWEMLYLVQEGSSVTGRYRYNNIPGQVIGTLEGNIIKGWWQQSSASNCGPDKAWDGPFALKFAEDGQSFIGDWGGCSDTPDSLNPNESTWNGTLVNGVLNISSVPNK